MMNSLILDDNMSNLTSASNEASISSSTRNEFGTMYPQQQSFGSPNQQPPPLKKKRNLPGNPDPDAEVVALSPKSLMATNRFMCEICNKGFQRDQNLQLHRRGHNLPWKLKQRSKQEVVKKKVYVCPESSCVHHDPSRALGDLTGIKKHFSRKHGEKKWKCEKCSKRYAVQSDWKAHSKICGTREYRCDCGTLFSRRDSFITHRAFCDALTEESARVAITANQHPLLSSHPITTTSTLLLHNPSALQPFPVLKREQDQQYYQSSSFNTLIRPPDHLPPWLAAGGPPLDLSTQLFINHDDQNPNPSNPTGSTPSLPSFQPTTTASPHMSATALLQKAAQMGVTMSSKQANCHMSAPSTTSGAGFSTTTTNTTNFSYTSLAVSTAGSGVVLSSHEEIGSTGGFGGNKAVVTSGCMEQVGATDHHDLVDMNSMMSNTSGFEGSSFEEALNGILNSKPAMETHLMSRNHEGGGSGGNDGLTRDFLGLRAFSHRGFPNMAGLHQMSSPSSYDQQNQNQTPWQG